MDKFLCVLCFVIINNLYVFGQLELCSGDKGSPVFLETFGSGNDLINKSAIGETLYKFSGKKAPKEGNYTISNKFNWFPHWFSTKDHTKRDSKGNALIVNVDEEKVGAFFIRKISGLCPEVSYEFSAWILNLSTSKNSVCTELTSALGGLPVNIRFEIWDETETKMLKTASTGQIFSESSPKWKKYGILFTTIPGQDNIVLKISNYAKGGCGNDVAIDDIQFVSCGEKTDILLENEISTSLKVCENNLNKVVLKTTAANDIFKRKYYQWQQSVDSLTFQDMDLVDNQFKISDSLKPGNYYYRVKVAGSRGGLNTPYCFSVSELFKLEIVAPAASPIPIDVKDYCYGEKVVFSVDRPITKESIKWYNRKTGGDVISESNIYVAGELEPGEYTYYAESKRNDFDCVNLERVPVKIKVHDALPELKEDRTIRKCGQDIITLDSGVDGVEYLWNTGETTKTIEVLQEGDYYVLINAKNNDYCKTGRNFRVNNIPGPVVSKVVNENGNLKVLLSEYIGEYEYSINGGATFKDSPVFEDIKNGRYKFYVKRIDSCDVTGPAFNYTKLRN